MSRDCQTTTRRVATGRGTPKEARSDGARAADESAIALPDTVTLAAAELAGEFEEGSLAFVVGAGLKALDVLFEQDATALACAFRRMRPERTAADPGQELAGR